MATRALAASLLLSTAAHAVVLALMFFGPRLPWPAPPIPIEVRPAHRTVRRVGPTERHTPPKPAAEATPKPVHAATPKAVKPTPPRPAPPPETTDLSPFAPDDAHLVVLLRMDKLRRSPHRTGAEALLGALPDWTTLVAGSNVSPIDDFEALLIATADPRDVTATFLAARYTDSAKVRALVDRKLPADDPRIFKILRPGLTVLTQPDAADKLLGARDLGDPRSGWLGQLERFDQVASAPSGPAVLVTLSDAPSLVQLGGGIPTPQAIALAATADASPAVRVRLVFATASEAQRFAHQWPDIVARFRSATALFGLAPALDGISIETQANDVELVGRVPAAQVRLGLSFATALLPRARPLDGGARPQ